VTAVPGYIAFNLHDFSIIAFSVRDKQVIIILKYMWIDQRSELYCIFVESSRHESVSFSDPHPTVYNLHALHRL